VISLGGFTGNDPVLSPRRLAGLVDDGAVRFFLLERNRSNKTASWITRHCEPVPTAVWQSPRPSARREAKGIVNLLYECAAADGKSERAPVSLLH
jgi:hypothetical protein